MNSSCVEAGRAVGNVDTLPWGKNNPQFSSVVVPLREKTWETTLPQGQQTCSPHEALWLIRQSLIPRWFFPYFLLFALPDWSVFSPPPDWFISQSVTPLAKLCNPAPWLTYISPCSGRFFSPGPLWGSSRIKARKNLQVKTPSLLWHCPEGSAHNWPEITRWLQTCLCDQVCPFLDTSLGTSRHWPPLPTVTQLS